MFYIFLFFIFFVLFPLWSRVPHRLRCVCRCIRLCTLACMCDAVRGADAMAIECVCNRVLEHAMAVAHTLTHSHSHSLSRSHFFLFSFLVCLLFFLSRLLDGTACDLDLRRLPTRVWRRATATLWSMLCARTTLPLCLRRRSTLVTKRYLWR